jgi:hypothetical protein
MMSRCGLAGLPLVLVGLSIAASICVPGEASAQSLPEIRISDRNRVPACVTPARLMRMLTERNPRMPVKFQNIAALYKAHGERYRVRWDYAFFQMIVETNYLLFKNGAGQGDVSPAQNNFAGIGTTGGGVPGDSFPDVSTGVLGQIQHLVAYSGEQVANPVANRTREKQDDIIATSQRLGRPVTFRDLSGRWAADRRYWRSISFVADVYMRRYCNGPVNEPEPETARAEAQIAAAVPAPALARRTSFQRAAALTAAAEPPPALLKPPALAPRQVLTCKVYTASYGGTKNVLIRRRVGNELQYTALQVLDGREAGLTEAFIRNHAQGGEALGEYPSRDDALTSAFNHCPGGDTTGGRG